MNTTQLECFMAVANFLNFSRAAEQLCITQPAVSHQIRMLENELGAKLFHRTSKSVRLTPEGHLFTQYAGDILNLSGLSVARIQKYREKLPLRLGIGCHNSIELRILQPVLTRLYKEMPELLPVLRLIPFASLENLLEDDSVQVILSFEEAVPQKTVYREFARCPLVCICEKKHPLAAHTQLTVAQLKESGRFATCPPTAYPPTLLSVQSRIVTEISPDQMYLCDNLEVAHALVEAGYAFAVVPDFPLAHSENLSYIPLPEFSPLSFGAVYRTDGLNSPLRLFLSLLKSLMQP